VLRLTDYEDLFFCEKCKTPLTAGIVRINRDVAQCTTACKNNHKKIIELPMSDKLNWIKPLTKAIYRCRCGEECTDLKMITTGEIIKLILYCKKHNKRNRKIDTILWNSISIARNELLESPFVVEQELPPPPTPENVLEITPNPKPAPNTSVESVQIVAIPKSEAPNQTETAFCPTCGEALPEGATKFCPNCGSAI
jgi:hypothetical protein